LILKYLYHSVRAAVRARGQSDPNNDQEQIKNIIRIPTARVKKNRADRRPGAAIKKPGQKIMAGPFRSHIPFKDG
jgi:hypothetical protein